MKTDVEPESLSAPPSLVDPLADLHCRVCELETENNRLRLLVGELLVLNQRLREGGEGPTRG
jgi:hypothetical protein